MNQLLSIGFANVQGFIQKVDLVKELIKKEEFGVFAVLETKADYNVSDEHFAIENYSMERINSIGTAGGIIAYVGKKANIVRVVKPIEYRCVAGYTQMLIIELIVYDEIEIVLVIVYISQRSKEAMEYVQSYCSGEYAEKLDRLVIIGDFNADLLSCGLIWPLVDAVDGIQTVKVPTHGDAVLDLVIIGNHNAHVETSVLTKVGSSDHNTVLTKLNMSAYGTKPSEETPGSAANQESSEKSANEPRTSKAVIQRRFKCSIDGCEADFSAKSSLLRHVREIHAPEPGYKCEDCPMQFRSEKAYIVHRRIHEGEKPYICSTCSARFSQRSNLQTHIKNVHEKQKCFECSQCDYKTGKKYDLKCHMRTHTGQRPYKCQQCGSSFSNSGNLRKHERQVHLGMKPFKCSYCEMVFASAANCTAHERVHTGEKPFECKKFRESPKRSNHERICGKAATKSENLMEDESHHSDSSDSNWLNAMQRD